ncbi:MAG: class I SAM-dependent methyltransferase [Woeseiaceae bacterium]
MTKSCRDHWERVYSNKETTELSWYQPRSEVSLRLIARTGVQSDDPILDAGGGASTLVDNLWEQGFRDITVLDISATALERAKARMGDSARTVHWVTADVTAFSPTRQYALWHDRAVFHFLVEQHDRGRYRDALLATLRPRGHLVLSTFGPDGPLRCSGLEICRYSIEKLQEIFDAHFELQHHELHDHVTPTGSSQQFIYSWWQVRTR